MRLIRTYRAGGGGGKSRERKTKLRVKNERLNEQRKRRMQEEEKLNKEGKKGNDKEPESTLPPADNSDIHPSRRGRVPGGSNDT